MSDKPTGSRKHKLTVSDRIVAVLLVVLALPMAPLMYLDGRLGWDGMPVICGVVVFWFVLIAGFWFMLGSFAPRYRGCRARAIFGRLGWWVMALMLCYLPFFFALPALGCLHRLKAAFTPEVIAEVHAASLRALARYPSGAVSSTNTPDTHFHDLPENVVAAIRKAGINRWDLRRGDDPSVWEATLWEASHIRGVGISIPGLIPENPPALGTEIISTEAPDDNRTFAWHAGSTLFYQTGRRLVLSDR